MKNLIILSTLLMLLSSCSSDDDSTIEEEQNTTQTRVKAININGNLFYDMVYNDKSRITAINIKNASGTASTIYTYNEQSQPKKKGEAIYTYNAEGRVSTITTSKYSIDQTYNEEGQIEQEIVVASNNNSLDSRVFAYNTQGQITEIKEQHISTNTGIAPYQKFIITYNNNANITKVVEKRSFNDTTYKDSFETTFGYDDKNNPLLNLQLNTGGNQGISHYMGVLHHFGDNHLPSEPRLYFYNKNNILFSARTNLNNNKTYKTTYEHQYNVEGYPIITTQTIFNPNSQTSDTIKYAWTYEKQ